MLLKKVTTGFVVQTFDTEKQKFVSQEFVAGDQCDYENEDGVEDYLPYDMVQPSDDSE